MISRLITNEKGQGLVEYTLMVLLVALVFWVAIKKTDIGTELEKSWKRITVCLSDPVGCESSS